MRFLHSEHGQSMAEYAILFAIVIGAAVAMQQYVKSRLQGAVGAATDAYVNAVGSDASAKLGNVVAFSDPKRVVDTSSNTTENLTMTSASAGTRKLDVKSDTFTKQTK